MAEHACLRTCGQTGPLDQLDIQFVAFEDVKILSGENRMVDLPLRWQRFALVDPQDQSPVVVIQYPVSKHEWLYVAAIVPVGESFYGVSWFTTERLISLVLSVYGVGLNRGAGEMDCASFAFVGSSSRQSGAWPESDSPE